MGNNKKLPDYLNIKKTCKYSVEKIPFVIRYVSDQYRTQKMWGKAILEHGETLKSIRNCYKNQKMCNKAVDNYARAIEFVPDF